VVRTNPEKIEAVLQEDGVGDLPIGQLRVPKFVSTRASRNASQRVTGNWWQDQAYKLTCRRSTTLPSLRRVQGNAIIDSTQALNCSDISSTLVQGSYVCHAAVSISANPSNAAVPPDHGLTGGAIGGIVVGIIAALALLAAGTMILYRRQRGGVQEPPQQQEQSKVFENPVHEVGTEQRRRDAAEKDGNAIFEMRDRWPDRGELPGSQARPNRVRPEKRYELS